MLETVFAYNPYPNREKIQDLADKLAVSKSKVYNWFDRKRSLSRQKTASAKISQSEYFALGIYGHSLK